jgi:hypothetical protein
MRLDPTQAALLIGDRPLELGSAQPQHAAQLLQRQLVVEQASDLLEREAEVAQRQ